jgi:uncharacterized membrane protein
MSVEPPTAAVYAWRSVVTLTLCIIGLAISTYTLWVHYHPAALFCIVNSAFDCQAVLTSAQSVIVGIPVPIFGILYFVTLGALCLPVAWRSPTAWIHWARLAGTIVGIGMVVYLISTELFAVKKICLWCTGVHIVTFALFVIIVTSTPALLERSSPPSCP